jgi:hypothetical protein
LTRHTPRLRVGQDGPLGRSASAFDPPRSGEGQRSYCIVVHWSVLVVVIMVFRPSEAWVYGWRRTL